MDLIIELIVFIFKALTGEKDGGRPAGKGGQTLPTATKRGPYNYGDGRSGAPVKPRTLEEILEEVKRQQAQGKAGGQRPNVQRAAPPPSAPSAQAKAKAPSLSRPLSEVQQPSEARAAAPAPLPSMGGAIQSSLETRMLKQSLDEKETVKPGFEKKFENLAERETQQALGIGRHKMVAEVNTVSTMGEIQSVDTMQSSLSEKKTNPYADFFKALRTAPPKDRADMARRAFVYAEVFGRPRSKRRLRDR